MVVMSSESYRVWSAASMHVLVAVASKHGSSLGIAEVVAKTLRSAGLEATLRRVEEVDGLDGFDAVVLGSGVYVGHWLRPARAFVDAHATALALRPMWLFSSGPVGDPPAPLEDPAEVADARRRFDVRDHRLFAGRIDGAELRVAERALVALVRAPQGDFRPWAEIVAWADGIAASLGQAAPAS
jgi:menaquinone-dependent protoporphyrinogen oxidase